MLMPAEPAAAVREPVAPVVTRSHRVLFWLALTLALVALGSGAAIAVDAYRDQVSPERVVRDYLAAVARADAATALSYGRLPAGGRDLLTAEVLAAQREIAPMTGIAVAVDAPSGDRAAARVRYDLEFAEGVQTVEDTLPLERVDGSWGLAAAAVPTTIRVVYAAHRATVAGANVPRDVQLVFPGALPVSFDTTNLGLGRESRVVRFADGDAIEEVTELSVAGLTAVSAALDAALAECLDGTSDSTASCPLPGDVRAVPGTLRGTLAQPASELSLIQLQADDGMIRINAQLTVTGSYEQLDFNNQRVVQSGDHPIPLLAICFATSPSSISFRPI